jgi:hypothetical protein
MGGGPHHGEWIENKNSGGCTGQAMQKKKYVGQFLWFDYSIQPDSSWV